MAMDDRWAGLGSTIASVMFLWAVARQYFPAHLDSLLAQSISRVLGLFYPYVEITFPERTADCLSRSQAYAAVEAYLGTLCRDKASRLRAEPGRDGLVFGIEDYEELADEFVGVTVHWSAQRTSPAGTHPFSLFSAPDVTNALHSYRLAFHRRHRKLVHTAYLHHVIDEGRRAMGAKPRPQRHLYTNRKNAWRHVSFLHPATFDTLAMEPAKKQELVHDLLAFSDSKEHYVKVGKPWKRGYLLHGAPGTGKTTTIACVANLLEYDVYDLDLPAVPGDGILRELLATTAAASVIVIEDIDRALPAKRKTDKGVTLSGLLSIVDGLWSACRGHVLLLTTRHPERLDPALVRPGRMDVHVELKAGCSFEGFKVLAKNYLGLEWHAKFGVLEELLEEREMSPADIVARLLRMKSGAGDGEEGVEECVEGLIEALIVCKCKQSEGS